MSTHQLIFYVFSGFAALSAVGMLFVKNVFKAALMLLVCLLSLAGIYVLAFAEFLAVTQIMIYAGGILVVIIFGVMLTAKISGKPLEVTHNNILSGLIAGIALAILLIKLYSSPFLVTHGTQGHDENIVTETGIQLMSTFVLPFEVAGVLLLMSLIGAAVVVSSFNKKN